MVEKGPNALNIPLGSINGYIYVLKYQMIVFIVMHDCT